MNDARLVSLTDKLNKYVALIRTENPNMKEKDIVDRAAHMALRSGVLSYDKKNGYRGPEAFIKLPNDPNSANEVIADKLSSVSDSLDILAGIVTKIEKSKIIDELFLILDEKKLLYEGILEKPKGDDSDWEPREQLLFRSSNLLDNEDRALKNQMVNGHILLMMQHII